MKNPNFEHVFLVLAGDKRNKQVSGSQSATGKVSVPLNTLLQDVQSEGNDFAASFFFEGLLSISFPYMLRLYR